MCICLDEIDSKMSRSSLSNAAGANHLWRDGTNGTVTLVHGWLNVTGLLADEWRDNLRLRYNQSLLDMPATCDGCGAKMSVEHALSSKTGGLVHIRHDDVADVMI